MQLSVVSFLSCQCCAKDHGIFEDGGLLPLVMLFLVRYEISMMYPLHLPNGTCICVGANNQVAAKSVKENSRGTSRPHAAAVNQMVLVGRLMRAWHGIACPMHFTGNMNLM